MYCPSGQMDKASVSGAEDCGFESHLGCFSTLRPLFFGVRVPRPLQQALVV